MISFGLESRDQGGTNLFRTVCFGFLWAIEEPCLDGKGGGRNELQMKFGNKDFASLDGGQKRRCWSFSLIGWKTGGWKVGAAVSFPTDRGGGACFCSGITLYKTFPPLGIPSKGGRGRVKKVPVKQTFLGARWIED